MKYRDKQIIAVLLYKSMKGLIDMSKQQLLKNLIADIPENKLDIILAFVQFILYEESSIQNSLLSEPSLAKDWMRKEEDDAWKNL